MKITKRPPRFLNTTTPVDVLVATGLGARLYLVGSAVCALGIVFGSDAHDIHALGIISIVVASCVWLLALIIGCCGSDSYELGQNYGRRLSAARATKATRYRGDRVVIQPEGEHVRIWRYSRAYSTPDTWTFHAENDADRAHDLIRSFREKPETTEPSTEARALANVLAGN